MNSPGGRNGSVKGTSDDVTGERLGFILLFLLVKPLGYEDIGAPAGLGGVRFFSAVAGMAAAKQWVGVLQEGGKPTVS
ncbi:hypothetical protein GCM10009132_32240 [Serratia ureilytica]